MEENAKRVDLDCCKSCLFYDTQELEYEGVSYERTYGYCRRFPPRRIDGTTSGFPVVEEDSWCGEHQSDVETVVS